MSTAPAPVPMVDMDQFLGDAQKIGRELPMPEIAKGLSYSLAQLLRVLDEHEQTITEAIGPEAAMELYIVSTLHSGAVVGAVAAMTEAAAD